MKPIRRQNTTSSAALAIAAITASLFLLPLRTDATEPDIVWSAQQHASGVTCVAYAPDGRHVASGGADRAVKLYDASDGRLRRDWMEHSDRVNAVAFSPDGRVLASGSDDHTIRFYRVQVKPR